MARINGYLVAFQRNCLEIETVCWNGSLDETIGLARRIAFLWKADFFRIGKFAESGAVVYWEARPFGDKEPLTP